MAGVTPEERPTRAGELATKGVREICMTLPLVTERLSHGEAAWFIDEKKNFVSMSDHHHDERISVSFAAAEGVQATLIRDDAVRYFRPPYVGGHGWVGAYLDGQLAFDTPEWDTIGGLIVDAWLLVAPAKLHHLLNLDV
jgi:hypothetical protein